MKAMTETEYNEKLKKIEADFDKAKKDLYIEYATSNATFEKGDIIRRHMQILLIDRISVHKSFGLPMPIYHGLELKKDLTPRKDRSRISIYGNDAELIKR